MPAYKQSRASQYRAVVAGAVSKLRVLPILIGLGGAISIGAPAQADTPKAPAEAQPPKPSPNPKLHRRASLRMQRNQRILSREEIEAAIAPHVPAIGACYKTHTANQKQANGRLTLELLIRPDGTLQRLWVQTPTVRGNKVSSCIQDLAKTWTFPRKPGFTNAVVPFYFQKTNAKGAGPFESCWNAKGCPDTPSKKRTRKKKK